MSSDSELAPQSALAKVPALAALLVQVDPAWVLAWGCQSDLELDMVLVQSWALV
jgi:hypothetical protein